MNLNASAEKNLDYAGAFGTIGALGFPLNALSLWILFRHHSLKSPSAVFMLNLALSDLLLVVSLPMRVYFHATGSWPLGHVVCVVTTALFRNNLRTSCMFMTVISLDRMLAVCLPLRSRLLRTASYAWKTSALIWFFINAVNLPESLELIGRLKTSNTTTCFQYYEHKQMWSCIFQLALVCCLLLVNVVSTALVTRTLRKLDNDKMMKNRVNVMMLFLLNILMFSFFFLPLSFGIMLHAEARNLRFLVCLASCNCCVDPLLYYFSFDGFWKKKERPSDTS